ncbi:helix-hairpin-helix domain-containing protein [Virgibacillus halophilus]|uniref:Helix-hairpin-helix domain-containing protein n=1 Tax=Tigheibacillus halophilus TaxID=361280 RepID=A0ABU5CBN9_9BACI|nr:helix-hairpin-helix domain-containing protein [Virgibacillus halophilus]
MLLSQMKSDEEDITETPFTDIQADQPESSSSSLNEKEQLHQMIMVDIKGSVVKPGVYEIAQDARVNDAIQLAGGFTKDADESQINLAQKVQDEMVIAVPLKNEDNNQTTVQAAMNETSEEKIHINQATQEELESLSGIGPSKANAILQYREENGMFQSVEELLEIPGIGEKTLENIRESIQVP